MVECDLRHNFRRRFFATVLFTWGQDNFGEQGMMFFRKWFGGSSSGEEAGQSAEPVRLSVRAETPRKTNVIRDYQQDASFSWDATEPLSSSLFDSPRGRIALVEDVREEEDNGYDPYDTGRFG